MARNLNKKKQNLIKKFNHFNEKNFYLSKF